MFTMMRGALLPAIVGVISLISIMAGPATSKLEAEPDSALPVPKNYSTSTLVNNVSTGEVVFRRQLDVTISADLGSVLAFYRSELGKRGWTESSEGAVVRPNSVQLAFATPDGSAALKLAGNKGWTIVNLDQKIPLAAAAANLLPNPGQAMLMLSNFGDVDAMLTIDGRTIRITPGENGLQRPSPTLELPPGTYPYALEVTGMVRNESIELPADQTWELSISPNGEVMPRQVY